MGGVPTTPATQVTVAAAVESSSPAAASSSERERRRLSRRRNAGVAKRDGDVARRSACSVPGDGAPGSTGRFEGVTKLDRKLRVPGVCGVRLCLCVVLGLAGHAVG